MGIQAAQLASGVTRYFSNRTGVLDSPLSATTLIHAMEVDGMKRAETTTARGPDRGRAADVFAGRPPRAHL